MAHGLVKRSDKGSEISATEYDNVVQAVIDIIEQETTLLQVRNISGMQIKAFAINYPIGTALFSAPSTTLNIATADATHPRRDLVIADVSNNISIIQGTPSINPTPNYSVLDTNSQFVLKVVLILANSTTPIIENQIKGKVKIDGAWFDTEGNVDRFTIQVGNSFEGWDGDYKVEGIVSNLPFDITDRNTFKQAVRTKAI